MGTARSDAKSAKRPRAKRSSRADFPEKVKLHVAHEVLLLCSKPDCRRPTYGPTASGVKLMNLGTAAHIVGAGSGKRSPRARDVSASYRRSAKNAIWLCRDHGKAVDDDTGAFTEEELHEWKRQAIEYAQRCIAARTLDVDGRQRKIFESRHELVKQLVPALAALNVARRKVASSLREWKEPLIGDGERARSRLSARERNALAVAASEVKDLEYRVDALFGAEAAGVVVQLRRQTRKLERYVAALLANDAPAMIVSAADKDEPIYGGRGHEMWMSSLTELIDEWSAHYLGRDGAQPMANAELVRRANDLRSKAAADGYDEWVAAHDAWDQAGDEEAYEEYWRERKAKEELLRAPIELGPPGARGRT